MQLGIILWNVQKRVCTLQEYKRSNKSIDTSPWEAPRKCKLGTRYIGVCNRQMQMAVPARIRNPISWLHANTRLLSNYEIVKKPCQMIYMFSPNLKWLIMAASVTLRSQYSVGLCFYDTYKIKKNKIGTVFTARICLHAKNFYFINASEKIKFQNALLLK